MERMSMIGFFLLHCIAWSIAMVDVIYESIHKDSKDSINNSFLPFDPHEGLMCNKKNTEIIFSLGDNWQTKQSLHTLPEDTDVLFQKIGETFAGVVLLVSDGSRDAFRVLAKELSRLGRIATGQQNATLVLMPHVYMSHLLNGPAQNSSSIKTIYRKVLKPVSTYVIPFMGNKTADMETFLKHTVLGGLGIPENEYTLGYMFNTSMCTDYSKALDDEAELADLYIKRSHKIVFYFEEYVNMSVDKMTRERLAVLEKCRKFVAIKRKLAHVKLSFMMLHYHTNEMFYQSRQEMLNYVSYLQYLCNWAVQTHTTVILNNAIDGYRYFNDRGVFQKDVGWWRNYGSEDFEGEYKASGENNNIWIDKNEEYRFRFLGVGSSKIEVSPGHRVINEVVMTGLLSIIITVTV